MPKIFAEAIPALERLELEKIIDGDDSDPHGFLQIAKDAEDPEPKEDTEGSADGAEGGSSTEPPSDTTDTTEESEEPAKESPDKKEGDEKDSGEKDSKDKEEKEDKKEEKEEPKEQKEEKTLDDSKRVTEEKTDESKISEESFELLETVGYFVDDRYYSTEEIRNSISFSLEREYVNDKTYEEKSILEYDDADWSRWGGSKYESGKTAVKNIPETDTFKKITGAVKKFASDAADSTGEAIVKMARNTELYVRKHSSNFNEIASILKSAKKALDSMDGKDIGEDEFLKEGSLLNNLMIESDATALSGAEAVLDFLKTVPVELTSFITKDNFKIKQFAEHTKPSIKLNVNEFLKIGNKLTTLTPGSVASLHIDSSNLVSSFIGNSVLPGNVVMVALLPNDHDKEIAEWKQAYKDSDLFLCFDADKADDKAKIQFLDKKELGTLINKLEEIASLCISQRKIYEDIEKNKLDLATAYGSLMKRMADSIFNSEEKQKIKDMISVKNKFIDKVYVPASIDIHSYVHKTLNHYLDFIKLNMKAFE